MDRRMTDLTIEINQRCLNKCLFCSSMATASSQTKLEPNVVIKVAREAASLGLKQISISGGEPLLHEGFPEILAGIQATGLKTTLYTSGICATRGGEQAAFGQWKDLSPFLDRVVFNLQSADPSVHDYLVCNKGAHSHTTKSLKFALKAGIACDVHVVPNAVNLTTLQKTVGWFNAMGVREASFLRLVIQGYGRANAAKLTMSQAQLTYMAELFKSLSGQDSFRTKLRFGIPFGYVGVSHGHCNAGITKLIIRYDGTVFPCEAFKDTLRGDYSIGNVKDDSLGEVFDSADMNGALLEIRQITSNSPDRCIAQHLCQA